MKKYRIQYYVKGFPMERVVEAKSLCAAVLEFKSNFPNVQISGAFEL